MPGSPQYRYTRDEQQLSQLLRAIDGVTTRLAARYALVGGELLQDVVFHTDSSGVITQMDCDAPADDAVPLLIPAVHNAHSHAFQWALRGKTHILAAGHEADDFWSWRETMYALADRLSPAEVEVLATEAYKAMAASGYASVGEFHYVHHGPEGTPTDPPWATAEAHVRAARAAGIHLTLIPVLYMRAGAGKPPALRQRRFIFESAEAFIAHVRAMRAALAGPGVDVAIGVHSVRAAPLDEIAAVARAADADGVVRHIHASEQRRELAECRDEHGMSPIAALRHAGFLGPRTTVVHATHLDGLDVSLLADSGTIVCACPTTERDLGDGLLDARGLLARGVPICVGSDSHAVVDAAEELRLLELHERLRHERRNVLALPERGWLRVSQTLMAAASAGAPALGLGSGDLTVSARLDAIVPPATDAIASVEEAWAAIESWLFVPGARRVERLWVGAREVALA
jgi:formimidoylglutamate deiminase